ncbi:hypothetical protein HDU97_007793 [Phlyctochytrium planicorne]|nr:hypothetical protein HDU97_007793 [Phlyctochytrium planicorne]
MKFTILLLAFVASTLAAPAQNTTAKAAAAPVNNNGRDRCNCPIQRFVGLGQACGGNSFNPPSCQQGFTCMPPANNNPQSQGTCVRLGKKGDICGRGEFGRFLFCDFDLTCFNPVKNGQKGGTCTRVLFQGETCKPGDVCNTDMQCIGGKCVIVFGVN